MLFQTFPVIGRLCLHGASIKLFVPVLSCEPSMQYHTLGNIGWVHGVAKSKTLVICFASPLLPLGRAAVRVHREGHVFSTKRVVALRGRAGRGAEVSKTPPAPDGEQPVLFCSCSLCCV